MTDIFAMQRANGDWFAIENHGRMRVPIFHTAHDALMARLRTVEMQLFSPIALNAKLLTEIVSGPAEVELSIIDDPFAGLRQGLLSSQSDVTALLASAESAKRESSGAC
jgi:hypothetical protein